jgi:hypothetical protein
MHAQDLKFFTAVGPTATAGEAGRVIDVRFDRTLVAGFDIRHSGAGRHNFHSQFVTGDSWIGIERHFPQVATDVGPANSDSMDPDQRLVRSWLSRFGNIDQAKLLWLKKLNRAHDVSELVVAE